VYGDEDNKQQKTLQNQVLASKKQSEYNVRPYAPSAEANSYPQSPLSHFFQNLEFQRNLNVASSHSIVRDPYSCHGNLNAIISPILFQV
jgi:hypothetical protein